MKRAVAAGMLRRDAEELVEVERRHAREVDLARSWCSSARSARRAGRRPPGRQPEHEVRLLGHAGGDRVAARRRRAFRRVNRQFRQTITVT